MFLKSIISSNFKRPGFPLKISYAITYKCNLKCKMCNIWNKGDRGEELNLNQISSFFKKADKFHSVGISGGEPFLRHDLQEAVDIILHYCKNLDVLIFSTNGQLTDKISDLAEYIYKKDKNRKVIFNISIDGPMPLHDEIRGVSGAWEHAVTTFKRLREIPSVKPQLGFTLTNHNQGEFHNTFIHLKDAIPLLRFDDITINVFQRSGLYYGNKDMQPLDDTNTITEIKKILALDKDKFTVNNFLRRTYLKLYLKYINTHRCPLKCQALSSSCFLDPYGNLFPCTVYDKRLLNINELNEGLGSAWNSENAKQLSRECSNHKCPSCWSPCDAYSTIGGSLLEACFTKNTY